MKSPPAGAGPVAPRAGDARRARRASCRGGGGRARASRTSRSRQSRCAKYSMTKCCAKVDEQRSEPCFPRLSFSSTGRGAAVQPSRRPGREDLGERPEVDDVLAAVERIQRRQRVALVAEEAVRVVLEHEQLTLSGDLDQSPATLERHRDARRIVEGGDRVDELRRAALVVQAVERLLQQIDAHAVRVHLDLDDVGLIGAERRHGARDRSVLRR